MSTAFEPTPLDLGQSPSDAIASSQPLADTCDPPQPSDLEINEFIPDVIYIYDLVGQHNVYTSRPIAELLGYSTQQIAEMELLGLANQIHPDDLEAVANHFQQLGQLSMGEKIELTYRMQRADGTWCHLHSQETLLRQAANGSPLQVIGFIRRTARLAHQDWCPALETELDESAPMVMMTDREGVIVYVNRGFEQITGYSCAEAIGQTPALLKSGWHDIAFYRRLWNTLQANQTLTTTFVNRRKNGELFHEEILITPLQNSHGQTRYFLSVGQELPQPQEPPQLSHPYPGTAIEVTPAIKVVGPL